ncbi:MAG: AEC family transporter [Clostridia bacterium]|nr:AEC family transporter [Clostridia bacterium]
MDALFIMFKNVLVFVALAIPGFILVKSKILSQEQSGSLSKLLMFVGMPFLILTGVINNISFDANLLAMIGIVTTVAIIYTIVAFFTSKPLSCMERQEKTRGMIRFSMVFSNNGFLGIPLAMAVFGANSMVVMVVIIINIITNVLMYTLCIYVISGDKKIMSFKKALFNPVLISFVIGIILNLLNVKAYVPEVVTFSTHFSNIVTPISMTILGMKMGGVNLLELLKSWKVYYVSALKLIVMPVIITALLFALTYVLPKNVISTDVIVGVLIAFSMPTAGLSSTFADGYNGDTKSAVAFTLGSTILSVITIPVLYAIINLLI